MEGSKVSLETLGQVLMSPGHIRNVTRVFSQGSSETESKDESMVCPQLTPMTPDYSDYKRVPALPVL